MAYKIKLNADNTTFKLSRVNNRIVLKQVGRRGIPGADGADGAPGTDGAPGVGVPSGGSSGQILAKNSNTNFDTAWIDQDTDIHSYDLTVPNIPFLANLTIEQIAQVIGTTGIPNGTTVMFLDRTDPEEFVYRYDSSNPSDPQLVALPDPRVIENVGDLVVGGRDFDGRAYLYVVAPDVGGTATILSPIGGLPLLDEPRDRLNILLGLENRAKYALLGNGEDYDGYGGFSMPNNGNLPASGVDIYNELVPIFGYTDEASGVDQQNYQEIFTIVDEEAWGGDLIETAIVWDGRNPVPFFEVTAADSATENPSQGYGEYPSVTYNLNQYNGEPFMLQRVRYTYEAATGELILWRPAGAEDVPDGNAFGIDWVKVQTTPHQNPGSHPIADIDPAQKLLIGKGWGRYFVSRVTVNGFDGTPYCDFDPVNNTVDQNTVYDPVADDNWTNDDSQGVARIIDTKDFVETWLTYSGGGSVSPEWGDILGTLSNQTDLQNALNAKLNLTGGTLSGALVVVANDNQFTIQRPTDSNRSIINFTTNGANAWRIGKYINSGGDEGFYIHKSGGGDPFIIDWATELVRIKNLLITQGLDLDGNIISNVSDPATDQDAATKKYVDDNAGGAVDSVNSQTGTVVLDQDDISDGTTYKQYSATEKTKLGHISVTQAVNLDTMESDIATNTTNIALKANAANAKGFVNHGSTAGTARPTGYASIEWYGSVEPTNMANGDTWIKVP